MDITLINFMNEQLDLVDLGFKRYMYDKLPWESRLVGLTGPRGVGKSTIIMQHIKEMAAEDRKVDQVTHLALRLGVKNADIGTLEVSFFILNIYHNPVILNID